MQNTDNNIATCPYCNGNLRFMFIRKELIPDWQISLRNVLDRLCNDEHEVLTPPNHAQETSRREQYHEKVTYISFQEGGYPDWTYVRINRRNDGAEARVLFDPDAYNHDEDTNKEIKKILNNEDEISDRMAFEYQFWTIHITEEKWCQIIDTLFNELHLLEWADEYTDPEVLDGTHWNLEIGLTKGNTLKYQGSNKYPPYWHALGNVFRELGNLYCGLYNDEWFHD